MRIAILPAWKSCEDLARTIPPLKGVRGMFFRALGRVSNLSYPVLVSPVQHPPSPLVQRGNCPAARFRTGCHRDESLHKAQEGNRHQTAAMLCRRRNNTKKPANHVAQTVSLRLTPLFVAHRGIRAAAPPLADCTVCTTARHAFRPRPWNVLTSTMRGI